MSVVQGQNSKCIRWEQHLAVMECSIDSDSSSPVTATHQLTPNNRFEFVARSGTSLSENPAETWDEHK